MKLTTQYQDPVEQEYFRDVPEKYKEIIRENIDYYKEDSLKKIYRRMYHFHAITSQDKYTINDTLLTSHFGDFNNGYWILKNNNPLCTGKSNHDDGYSSLSLKSHWETTEDKPTLLKKLTDEYKIHLMPKGSAIEEFDELINKNILKKQHTNEKTIDDGYFYGNNTYQQYSMHGIITKSTRNNTSKTKKLYEQQTPLALLEQKLATLRQEYISIHNSCTNTTKEGLCGVIACSYCPEYLKKKLDNGHEASQVINEIVKITGPSKAEQQYRAQSGYFYGLVDPWDLRKYR